MCNIAIRKKQVFPSALLIHHQPSIFRDTCTYKLAQIPNDVDIKARINFKVMIYNAIEFFYHQSHSFGNDNAKIHTFLHLTKFILSYC